jgi:hypothetical protein
MTIAEFILELQKYPQDMRVFCMPPDYDAYEVVLAELIRDDPCWWSVNPDGSSPHNVIAKFEEKGFKHSDKAKWSGKITWTDPKTFKATGEQK